jgi:hypothetical protein
MQPEARQVADTASIGTAAAVATGKAELLLLAVAPLLLIAAADRGPRPTTLAVTGEVTPSGASRGRRRARRPRHRRQITGRRGAEESTRHVRSQGAAVGAFKDLSVVPSLSK